VGAVPSGAAGGGILNAIFGGGTGANAGGAGAQPAWALQLEQDLPWLLLGIGVIVAIPSIIKKL